MEREDAIVGLKIRHSHWPKHVFGVIEAIDDNDKAVHLDVPFEPPGSNRDVARTGYQSIVPFSSLRNYTVFENQDAIVERHQVIVPIAMHSLQELLRLPAQFEVKGMRVIDEVLELLIEGEGLPLRPANEEAQRAMIIGHVETVPRGGVPDPDEMVQRTTAHFSTVPEVRWVLSPWEPVKTE